MKHVFRALIFVVTAAIMFIYGTDYSHSQPAPGKTAPDFKVKDTNGVTHDLSKMKSRKNPYASKLKKPVTIRLSEDVIDYFKGMAEESGVPYQSLINLYLRDCASQHRKVDIQWQP